MTSPSGQVKCIIFCARIVPRRQPKRRKNPLNFKKNALNRGENGHEQHLFGATGIFSLAEEGGACYND